MFGVMIPNLSRTDKTRILKRQASRVTNIINFKSTIFKPRSLLYLHVKISRVAGRPAFVSDANFSV